MLQKTAKKAKKTNAAICCGNPDAKAAAKKARAVLRSIKPLSLKAMRNKVLGDAIERFEKRGWVQGDLHTSEGFCAIGAILDQRSAPHNARNAAVDALYQVLPPKRRNYAYSMYGYNLDSAVVSYNDADRTTKRKVVELFKKAKRVPMKEAD